MLLGRSVRTFKHLFTQASLPASLPKPTFIHHGLAPDTASTPRIIDHRHPVWEAESSQYPTNLQMFLNHQPSHPATPYMHPAMADSDVISAYLAIRRFPSSLQNLRPQAYERVSKHAEAEGLQQIMGVLAEDVLSHFPQSDPQGFSESVIAILSHATPQCPLSHRRILRLYESLVIANGSILPPLNPDVVQRIATAAMMRPYETKSPLDTLGSALLSSDTQTAEDHTKSTQLAYELLTKVLFEGENSYPRALGLFQKLIGANRIPKQAQARAAEQGGSFQVLIISALVRACLWFEWREKAADLLMEIFQNPEWSCAKELTEKDVQLITDLTLEVLCILLPSTSHDEIEISKRLIMALTPITSDDFSGSHPPPLEIPHHVLFAFYDSCHNCKLIGLAAKMYHHLQSPEIRQHHYYPPPRHSALLWLLHHFASPGISLHEEKRRDLEGHLYIARSMVSDILHRKHPVPLMDRPRLVALVAARGFGMHARQLWEMYTAEGDPDRDIVRGNARVLVQLVKLFVRTQQRWDTSKRGKSMNTRTSKEANDGVGSLGENRSGSDHLPRDYLQFAERVLASFVETKVPLAMASHFDLNALTRAQLLVGNLPEGVNTLSHIMERGDAPQVMDINVVLAGLSRYSPSRAADMIQDMIERGLLPSAPTFSTVIHEALRNKDTELAHKLVSQARGLGHGSLTPKGLASLIRSMMTFEYTSKKEERLQQKWKVRHVLKAVETIMEYRPETGNSRENYKDHAISVSVGIDCVKGSLKALRPRQAFQFWRLLMKDRVLWDDREHKDLRAWIARLIRHQWRNYRLETNSAAMILDELRVPGVAADGGR